MFQAKFVKTGLLAAALLTTAFAPAAHADYHFNFAQSNSLSSYADVSFVNAINADIYDANFDVIGQHWIADPDASAVTLESMSAYGYNGSAAAGVTGLQALWQPVLMQFSNPISITSFQLKQDDSGFGFPGQVDLTFLNANGQQVGNSVNYFQNATSTIQSGAIAGGVSSVLLSSGKFYTSIDAITAVPEPQTYALLLTGLALMGVSMRRRRDC